METLVDPAVDPVEWYYGQGHKRELDGRPPIVPSPDHIHLFVAGGEAGRFSAFIPGWGPHEQSRAPGDRRGGTAQGTGMRGRYLPCLIARRSNT